MPTKPIIEPCASRGDVVPNNAHFATTLGQPLGVTVPSASSHLAEQIGVKAFVPVIAISSDHTLASVHIPCIFRLPEGTSFDQALPVITAAEQQAAANRSKLCDVLSSRSPIAEGRFQSTGESR